MYKIDEFHHIQLTLSLSFPLSTSLLLKKVQFPPTMFVILFPQNEYYFTYIVQCFRRRKAMRVYVHEYALYLYVLYYNISTWWKNDGAIKL